MVTSLVNKSLTLVLALIMGVVAVSLIVQAGPGLVGDMIVDVDDSYVENATGCYIDQPAGTGDTEVEGFYCTGFSLLPLIIVALFFIAIAALVISVFAGYIKLPKL